MPRRKSLIAQMYEAHQKAKLQRQKLEDQASRAWAEEERKVAAQAAKEAAQQRREEERAAQARLGRSSGRANGSRRRRRRSGWPPSRSGRQERQAAAEAREQQQREAEERREQQRQEAERRRRAVERRAAEAEFRTEAVRAKIAAFERLLSDRNRHLAAHSRRPRTPSMRMARKRSWRRSSGRWPPRCTRRAWTGRARPSTCRSPVSCGWSTSCPARTSSPR